MAITVSEWDHTLDTTPGASSQATTSHTYTDGYLYVCFVTQKRTDSTEPPDPTVAGLGATWSALTLPSGYWDSTAASMRKTSAFKGTASGSGSGAVTVSYATQPGDIDIVVLEFAGGDDVVQIVDWHGSWTANTLNERLTMVSPAATSRVASYAVGNIAFKAAGGATVDPRMELSTDSGGEVDWTSFTYYESNSSPTGGYNSGYYNGDPTDDVTPGWMQEATSASADAYMVAVEVSQATASPTAALPGWGIIAAQGTVPTAPDVLLIGATIDNGTKGGGPVGETDAQATARLDADLSSALGSTVGIQIGRRFTGTNPSNFASVAEFAQDIGVRDRIISIKGATDSQPTQAQLETFINSIPVDGYVTYLIVHHEPDNDGGTHTPTWFTGTILPNLHAAWVASGSRTDVRPSFCLTTYLERSGGDSSLWFPTSNIEDFYFFMDPYTITGTWTLEALTAPTLALWLAAGGGINRWGLAETGTQATGAARATWISDGIAWCRANQGVAWCWYHSIATNDWLFTSNVERLPMAQAIVASGG